MKKVVIIGLILLAGCAGGNYSSQQDGGNNSSKQDEGQFDPETCKNIPLGLEEYQALGGKGKLIKCSDLERCAEITGQTPPDIPCE